MIDQQRVLKGLQSRFGELKPIRPGVFRAAQSFGGRDYAVRYFDLTGKLDEAASHLREYQEDLMAETYFGTDAPSDLRWNHYLYFVATDEDAVRHDFRVLKSQLESDRTYARKAVLTEHDVEALGSGSPDLPASPPLDVAAQWAHRLDELGLSFILDDGISAPEAARLISKGVRQPSARQATFDPLSEAERLAGSGFLNNLTIQGFRKYPTTKQFTFGSVNLIFGRNGSGKTSLLEAIEYLYCGANKRGADRLPGTKLSGAFVGGSVKLVASSTSPTPSQQRSRNAHWYSRVDVKKATVCDSFGKFNFLDTDAAVHLSREDDSNDRLTADVARLILGAEAEKLSNKMERVAEKIEAEHKEKAHDARDIRQRLADARARLELIRKVPLTSDSAFTGLLETLRLCGWRSIPKTKTAAQTIASDLRAAVVAAKRVAKFEASIGTDERLSLADRRRQLVEDIEAARKKLSDLQASLKQLVSDRESVSLADHRLRVLQELQRYVQTGLQDKLSELLAARARVDQRSVGLASLDGEDLVAVDESEFDSVLLTVALSAQDEVKRWETSLRERTSEVKGIEAAFSSIAVLRQRMIEAGAELIARAGDPDHCPICHTQFEPGHLKRLMDETLKEGPSEVLSIAQSRLLEAKESLARAADRQRFLQLLNTFVGSGRAVSLREAIDAVRSARTALEADRERSKGLESAIAALAEQGLTESDMRSHLRALGLSTAPSPEELDGLIESATKDLAQHLKSVDNGNAQVADHLLSLSKLSGQAGRQSDADPSVHIQLMTDRLATLDVQLSAVQTLESVLDRQIASDVPLELRLEQATDQLARLQAALDVEAHATSSATTEEHKISSLANALEERVGESDRLSKALAMLQDLLAKSRAGEFVNEVLRSNAAEISRIFSAIHAPNEFTINAQSGGLKIIRDATSAPATLNQMSTGQRAAYALSLFLAMNARLRAGPPLIVLDDPIAHIDDLNILSFLDHLRDLALTGSRQIFIATADDKLAALVRQKFRFLGSERFKDIPLSRD